MRAEWLPNDYEAALLARVYQKILSWQAPLEKQPAGSENTIQESEPADESPAKNGSEVQQVSYV